MTLTTQEKFQLLKQSPPLLCSRLLNSVEKQPTGPLYWKFNSGLLEDPEYINLKNDNVPSWLVEFSDVLDKGLLWDLKNKTSNDGI